MQHLLQFGLSNAVAAAVLAVLAAVATRVWRNPYFAYALWLVVLLRLVAPPLLPVGVPVPEWLAGNSREPLPAVSEPEKNVPPPVDVSAFVARSTGEPKPSPVAPDRTARMAKPSTAQFAGRESNTVAQAPLREDHGDPEGAPPRDSLGLSKGVPEEASKPSTSRWPSIANRLAAAWLTGTLCYLLLTTLRVRTFARVLRRARREVPAGVAAEAAEVAAAVGLRRAPRLAFAEAALPPMVWPGWRSVVLLPKALFTSLGAAERRLLLWHEFVHLRRRDHLVRWFEVGVVGLYWWNPVAWWAVARLQQAEEDCCDAAILVAHPHESARYGETLVSVAQFLSAGTLPTPSLSLGVARNHHIKRRLTMILHGPRWPELSKSRLAAFSLLGAALVAVTWTAAKGQTAPASPAASAASPSSSKTEESVLADSLVKPQGERIDEILVEGNATIPAAAILEKLKTQAGGTATPSQVQQDIRTLIKTRWFFSVAPTYRRTDKKRTLVFVVVERPTVRSLEYQGAKEISLNKLAVETGLKVGSPFSSGANQDAARHLENFYHEQGYTEATVELIKGDKPDDYDVVFRIHEGVKQKVVGRYFVGNKSVSDEELAMELESSPAYVFNAAKVDPVHTTEDVAALRKYYADLGFFDATVKRTVHYSKDRKSISLEYAVHESVRYKIRDFGISSEVPFKMDELLQMSRTHQGQLFDGFQIREELKKLKERYAASGFTPPDVGIRTFFPPGLPGIVDLSVRVLRENKKRESLPSAPAQGSNGDTKNGAALLVAQAEPVPQAQSVPLSKMEPMQPAPGDDELRRLQKERYNAALRELKLNEYQFDIGTTRVSAVCQATRKFVEAWQALAQRPADELRAVDWYVGYTNRLWNGAHARLIAGGVTGFTAVDEAEARAARLEAQIESMKLRQRLASKAATATQGALEAEQAIVATARSTASASRKRIFRNSYERTDSGDPPQVQSGLFPPNLMPMSIAPSDDEERKLHKQQYNAAAEEMEIYRKEWRAGKLDLAAQIENVLAAAGKMRDAELPLCSDAAARLATLEKYLDLTRSLEQVALGWVKHGVATANAPREAVRMHEASLEAELQIARIRRELAQNEQQNRPPSPPKQTPHTALPQLLTKGTNTIGPNDEELRVKLLKERYNALQSLKGVNKSHEPGTALTESELVKAARELLAAQVSLARPRDLVTVYEGYVEMMKYLESLTPTPPPGATLTAPEVFHVDGFREARLEGEQKLAEAKQAALNEREKQPAAATGPSPSTQPGAVEGAAKSVKPVPPIAKALFERLPLLLTRPLERQARDDEWHKLLKQRFNSAAVVLRLSYQRFAFDPAATATKVIAAARRVLEADLALTIDPEFSKQEKQTALDAWQRYFELMEFLEQQTEARFKTHIGGTDKLEEVREARLEAERKLFAERQKLVEAKQAALNEREKQPAGTPGASVTEQPEPAPAVKSDKPAPPVLKGSTEQLPALLASKSLEPAPGDDERLTLLKKRYNAALQLLRASYAHHELNPTMTVANVIAAARRVLAADLALLSDPKFGKQPGQLPVDARQRFFELMKYFEREAEGRFAQGEGGSEELEATHEARLDAELELLEEKSAKAAPTNFQTPRTWITR